jgi:hypothetical protein
LQFLIQSPWNLGTQLNLFLAASGLLLYSHERTTQKTQCYCRAAQIIQKTSHVITKWCWSVTSLRLRGSVITETLPRSGLHNPVVPLLVRVLLRNVCFCGSTILVCGKYATIFTHQWLYSPLLGPGLFSFVIIFTQTVRLLGRVTSPSQGRYLHTGQIKHRINAHTDIHTLSGI